MMTENQEVTKPLPPQEVYVDITQDELCAEISENNGVDVTTVKKILSAFIEHQLREMDI